MSMILAYDGYEELEQRHVLIVCNGKYTCDLE